MAETNRDGSAAVLVGRLIRSYRSEVRRNGRALSQEGLLDLMVDRGEDYAAGLERSSVSHWERGVRLAPREFLVALGRALNIPKAEIDLILVLAGHDSPREKDGRDAILAAAQSIESSVERVRRDVLILMDSTVAPEASPDAFDVVKGALRKAALPAVYALAVGFLLNAMGLNGMDVLLAYALAAASIVIGQWVLQWLKSAQDTSAHDHIAGLLFISLFIALNSSVLMGAATKADHFGFYTLGSLANTPMPFLLTMLANLLLSLVATVIFSLVWHSQYRPRVGHSALTRAVFITFPPILFVYANIIVFTNIGGWIYFMIVFGVMFGAFTAIVSLNEPGLKLGNDGFALKAVISVIILLCATGVASIFIAYLEPDLMKATSDFRIIPLPEVSHDELGYTAEEGVWRLRLGFLYMSVATILYLAVVVGGYLIMTVRRASV